MYEWIPYGSTAPRREPYWKIVLNQLKAQWPTAYRDTSAIETPSEHVLQPFTLKSDIGWGVAFKHFDSASKICTITAYIDDKYNDNTERKYPGGDRVRSIFVCVDMTYRFTKSVTTLDEDNYPIQFEGNKNLIQNILADVNTFGSQGIYIYEGRTIFDGRYSDEEIFLERLSRDVDPKAPSLENEYYWIYRKIYRIEAFEKVRLY